MKTRVRAAPTATGCWVVVETVVVAAMSDAVMMPELSAGPLGPWHGPW